MYHDDDLCVKKDTSVEYDVAMDSYDGVEVWKIVWLFVLDMLSKLFVSNSIGLYRGNSLSVFRDYNGHQGGKVRKDLMTLFREFRLNLDIIYNLKIVVYYLKVWFDSNKGILQTFQLTQQQAIIY